MKTLSAAWTWICLVSALLGRLASETLWPWVRFAAEILGWATAVSLVWFTVRVNQYEHRTGRRYAVAPVAVSPVAVRVAAKLTPELQSLATAHKDEIIAASGNAVERFAAKQVFPFAVRAIPKGAEFGCDAALDYLDTLRASEVAEMLVDHADSKGRTAHWTLRAAKEMGR
jgi:hypothetical protein